VQELKNTDLFSLQTKHMQQDPTTKAMCVALDPQIKAIAEEVKQCLILARVNELPEELLDELAWEFHIDWYDATAPLEVKRELIRKSDQVHMYHGTPYAVEQVLYAYFQDARLQEWFEYQGAPYHFRIITGNPDIDVSGTKYQQLLKILDKVKRKSAVYDGIVMTTEVSYNTYAGFIGYEFEHCTLEVKV